jgi:predicted metal-dependent hydrolase
LGWCSPVNHFSPVPISFTNQISKWKKQLIENTPQLFNGAHKKKTKEAEEIEAQLYQQIGQLKVEIDWLKLDFHPLGGVLAPKVNNNIWLLAQFL